jgi:hypothetical protein
VHGVPQVAVYQRARKVKPILRPSKSLGNASHPSPQRRVPGTSSSASYCTICARCSSQRCLSPLPIPPTEGTCQPRYRGTQAMRTATRSSTQRVVVSRYYGRSRSSSVEQCCRASNQRSQYPSDRHDRATPIRTQDRTTNTTEHTQYDSTATEQRGAVAPAPPFRRIPNRPTPSPTPTSASRSITDDSSPQSRPHAHARPTSHQ